MNIFRIYFIWWLTEYNSIKSHLNVGIRIFSETPLAVHTFWVIFCFRRWNMDETKIQLGLNLFRKWIHMLSRECQTSQGHVIRDSKRCCLRHRIQRSRRRAGESCHSRWQCWGQHCTLSGEAEWFWSSFSSLLCVKLRNRSEIKQPMSHMLWSLWISAWFQFLFKSSCYAKLSYMLYDLRNSSLDIILNLQQWKNIIKINTYRDQMISKKIEKITRFPHS